MKLFILHTFILFFTGFVVSCIKNDYTNCNNEKGVLIVIPDWSNIGDYITIPEYFDTQLSPSTAATPSLLTQLSFTNNTWTGIEPGFYTLYTYNEAENITVSENKATVKTKDTSHSTSLLEQPGYFFSAVNNVSIPQNQTVTVYPEMIQQVRHFTLIFNIKSSISVLFSHFSGIISGVAGSLDLETNQPGDPSSVEMIFSQHGAEVSVGIYLLGIVPDAGQYVTVEFTYHNIQGSITVNLSTLLRYFYIEKRKPMILRADLYLDAETEMSGSISNWRDVTETINPN